MKANPIAVIFAALGCGGVAAVATFLVTPAFLMAFGYATYEMDLHHIRGDEWAMISGGATVVTVPLVGLFAAVVGAALGFFLTRQAE